MGEDGYEETRRCEGSAMREVRSRRRRRRRRRREWARSRLDCAELSEDGRATSCCQQAAADGAASS